MNQVASIKARLKNYAKETGRTFQDVLTMYVLERVIYRISVSDFSEDFTLKGGILLYGIYSGNFTRATTDIDLLGNRISNDVDFLQGVFRRILKQSCDDPIRFDTGEITVEAITEFKEYHGVRVSTTAYLDRTRIPVSIDIGFGDVIYPERQKMAYPSILGDEISLVYIYSKESIIAEKLEAIVSLGIANSRYKDFYDICILSEREDFDGSLLSEAIKETFEHRNTRLNQIASFEDDFVTPIKETQWKGFLRNKCVKDHRNLTDVLDEIKVFLLPVIQSIQHGQPFNQGWNHIQHNWTNDIKRL